MPKYESDCLTPEEILQQFETRGLRAQRQGTAVILDYFYQLVLSVIVGQSKDSTKAIDLSYEVAFKAVYNALEPKSAIDNV